MADHVSEQDAQNALIYKDGILDYAAHDAYLKALGYSYLALPCGCGGSDTDGHLPSCGWGRVVNDSFLLEPLDEEEESAE